MSTLPGTRRLEFEGAHNLRDLGGYASSLGGHVRWGVVFRSGALDRMTPAGLDALAELGITTIYDLRRDDERLRSPDPLPNVHVCLASRVMATKSLPKIENLVALDHGHQFLSDLFRALLAHASAEIGQLMRGFADPAALPALFHCTAGKDRTGVVAALLLTWLGVDREDVLDDFELTSEVRHHAHNEEMFQHMLEVGFGPEAAAGMLDSPRSSMAEMLDDLDATYGGIERYLREQAGLDTETLQALRANLLH